MTYRIRNARIEDSAFLAETVMNAVGIEACVEFAGGVDKLHRVRTLFANLAQRSDSQYSYKNSLIAENDNSEVVGALIAYDGAQMHYLRQAFVEETKKCLNIELVEADMDNETSDDEIYLDSLFVLPQFRHQGVASLLIKSTIEKFKHLRKPYGLITEPSNHNAIKLYETLGFRPVGLRKFIGIEMIHFQYD